MLSAHLVSHTHWDREWYHEFVRFRQRLVALVDELLDDPPAPNESFLLDGQAIVLEDYLEVRPEREEELANLLWSGRLEAGPWYVLADELIPGGEALVRNLLVGRRVLRRLHADAPPVLYCPDSFGHPAALPAIAAGFGLPLIVLWRGFGGRRWPATDTFQWRAPGGERVIAFHLPPNGYELGSNLPPDADTARERWRQIRGALAERALTGVVLVQNGADHHARQLAHREAAQALAVAAVTNADTLRPSSMRGFAEELVRATKQRELTEVTGELRDSYGYTWTLQGTFASRAAQKRRNAQVERLLTRDAEPWAALARRHGAPSRVPLLVAAWRSLLQTHPHDTLCGCSIDAVAAAMERRLDDATSQARGIRDDALADLVGHDPVAARTAPNDWRPVVLVRNRAPRPRGGVAIIELQQFIAHVPVGPGSAPTSVPELPAPPMPRVLAGSRLQPLGRHVSYDRVESPRHYPDNDLVMVTRAAAWVAPVPAYGVVALPLGEPEAGRRRRSSTVPNPVRGEASTLDNGIVRVTVSRAGQVTLEASDSKRRLTALLTLEDRVDAGDLYTPSLRDTAAEPTFVESRLTRRGPLVGELRLRWRLRPAKGSPTSRAGPTDVAAHIGLVADSALVRLQIEAVNRARDHRLRLGLRTDIPDGEVWADAAFGPVRRLPLSVPNEDLRMETPPSTAPLHRYVSLFTSDKGATLLSDGLAEYEATCAGELFVTLVRAVGELSRNDLPERPGHAGWPAATPAAQSIGHFSAQLGVLLHGPRTAASIDEIERSSDELLLPLEGQTLRSALRIPSPVAGAELTGTGLAFSALKESEDGEWLVARCVNLVDSAVEGVWRFGFPAGEARYARLDETPSDPLTVTEDGIAFRAGPRAIVTILVR